MNEETLEKMGQELESIKQRNARVEADKAWEVSAFRIISICAITYIVACALLFVIRTDRFWLGALVPPVGFLISSQSLPAIKRWWIKARYKSTQSK